MRSQFDQQLAQLHRELIEMGALCEEVIALSSQALTEGDASLARRVAPLDRDIDRKERDIENLCLRLLLHQQPVAGDLRRISALGRYAPYILEENDFEMLFVANCFRPLTRTPQEAFEVLREIEAAGGIPFTGIVNNSNLGNDTTADDILAAQDYAAALCALSGLPLRLSTVKETLIPQLTGRVPSLFPLRLQAKYYE